MIAGIMAYFCRSGLAGFWLYALIRIFWSQVRL
jgi:hypothetical protein